MSAKAPIGAPALWRAVIERDGGQCTCTGACGRRHTPVTGTTNQRRQRGPGANAVPSPVGRCTAGTGPTPERLYVVPAEGPDPQPWSLPVAALTTRCDACVQAGRRAAGPAQGTAARAPARSSQPAERSAQQPDPGQDVLFELPTRDVPEPGRAPTPQRHRVNGEPR